MENNANRHFVPASTFKTLKGMYIVWKSKEGLYYANGTGQNQEDHYNCGYVARKQGDMVITTKYKRVPLYQAYVVSPDIAAKWPRWQGEDAILGNKRITRSELMEILPD